MTDSFPRHELYSLTSQMRRSAYSIPMNIAEGRSKSSDSEFGRFLDIASGSAGELDYQLLLVKDLGLIDSNSYSKYSLELEEIRKMLNAYRQAIIKANS